MAHESRQENTIELVEEQLEVGKRDTIRARVQVRTRTTERDEIVETALRREDVIVERVPLGVPVETAPGVREEDGVLIVPVLEEQVVVQTRLILKEEIRISKKSDVEVVRQKVRLRAEQAEVTRLEGDAAASAHKDEGD